jgi:hypothetical protein
MKNTSMQSKFESKMLSGATLTVSQLQNMGFANPADAAYKARQKGISVQRSVKTTRSGEVSQYSVVA